MKHTKHTSSIPKTPNYTRPNKMIKLILISAVLAAQKPFEERCPDLITPDAKLGVFTSAEHKEQYFACLDARHEKFATTELIVNSGQGYTGRVK